MVLGMLAVGGIQAQSESGSTALNQKPSVENGTIPTSALRAEGDLWSLDQAAESYAGGTGTEADPYQIATVEQFIKLCKDTYDSESKGEVFCEGVYFKQTADIDLSAAYSNALRIGLGGFFSGTYDGGNFAIKGFKQIGSSDAEIGSYNMGISPFANALNATIKNVVMEDYSTEINYSKFNNGGIRGGMLVYEPQNTVIENCTVSGDINITASGENLTLSIGGLSGNATDTKINNCHTSGTITIKYNLTSAPADDSNFSSIGGIVAEAVEETIIMNSTNAISIDNEAEGTSDGGITARVAGITTWSNNENTKILNCSNTGALKAVSKTANNVQVAGIISCCVNAYMANVWNASTLISEGGVEGSNIGGIVAYLENLKTEFCAYDKDLYGATDEHKPGNAYDTDFMQSQDFVDRLNSSLPEDCTPWQYVEGSYPVLGTSEEQPEDPTASESIAKSEISFRTVPGAVVITAPEATQFAAYTFTGATQATQLIPAGTTTVNLPAGLYILKIGEETYKVNVK